MGADAPADAAERIRALGDFARELVLRLQAFASGLAEDWLSYEYKKARQEEVSASPEVLQSTTRPW